MEKEGEARQVRKRREKNGKEKKGKGRETGQEKE